MDSVNSVITRFPLWEAPHTVPYSINRAQEYRETAFAVSKHQSFVSPGGIRVVPPTEEFDCAVVGAGPAGTSAALVMARAGLNVVFFERGEYPGAKNVMGGILYSKMLEGLVPEFWKEAPLERPITEEQLLLLSEDGATGLLHKSGAFGSPPYNSFSVLRSKFDRWFAKQAVDAGALLIAQTVVTELLRDPSGRVVGLGTDRPDGRIMCKTAIIAEGSNTLLLEGAGLRARPTAHQMAVAVKETISLPRATIQDRFHLTGDEGAALEFVGEATAGHVGTAFVYTNKDSLSIGVGALISDLVRSGANPTEMLERFKAHPVVAPLLEGGQSREFVAHMIPEGGYDAMPPLFGDGFLVAGDAAMMVNPIHREGSNLAMTAGRLAGETVVEAHKQGDFSKATLARYAAKLNDTFVIADLKKYRKATRFFESRPEFFRLYPSLVNKAVQEWYKVDGVKKREKQKKILAMVRGERPLRSILRDLWGAWRSLR